MVATDAAQTRSDAEWLGHPRALAPLFFTEMWERFSYYGMRALLVLFMVGGTTAANEGLGFGEGTAATVYGLYSSMVYLLALPGGWLADKLWGQQRAVWVGAWVITAGHFTLAAPLVGVPSRPSFFAGLVLVAVGTGLLKPNVSTIVGQLYDRRGPAAGAVETDDERDRRDARRDAGFSMFYMGINLGAILGPLVCGWLGEKVNYHWGFSAAGFGMLLGLAAYSRGRRQLGTAGARPDDVAPQAARARRLRLLVGTAVVVLVVGLLTWATVTEVAGLSLSGVANGFGYVLVVVTAGYLAWLVVRGGYDRDERRRIVGIGWLILLAAVFWSGFEQAGSSLNLFALDDVDRTVLGWQMPTTWLQNINPVFIIVFAPVFGWLWTWLAARHRNPSVPVKFALGLLGVSAGFLVVAWGAANAGDGAKAPVTILVATYFLHTVGELCLSPVGLSTVTKWAPADRTSQMMGLWFVASAIGSLFAGLTAARLEDLAPADLFRNVALYTGAVGLLALALSPLVRRVVPDR